MKINGIMIAAPSSGSGKTTVTCALLSALKKRGIHPSAMKCGPDYIDPMFHRSVLGIDCGNLDLYLSDENTVKYLYSQSESDITITEGVMGVFDGLSISDSRASSYAIAEVIGVPIILVMPCRGMGYTAAAFVKGMVDFKRDTKIKGVILNNVTPSVYKMLKPVIERESGCEVVGYFPQMDNISLKSRHLGLVTPDEIADIKETLDILGDTAEKTIDIDRILEISRTADDICFCPPQIKEGKKRVKIAVARDEAFCFYYKENIELLKRAGADIVTFSPLRDSGIPKCADGVIFGGGYPELWADKLSQNTSMLSDVHRKLTEGMPCLAECGGFMYLHKSMQDSSGAPHRMVGFIDADAIKTDKLVRFGYIAVTPKRNSNYIKKGHTIRAHEFHYWDSTDNGDVMTAEKPSGNRRWDCMHEYKNTLCGFAHMYYCSDPEIVYNFIERCGEYKDV